MKMEAIKVSLEAVQAIGAKKVQDTKTTLNNEASFADTLGDARAVRNKDKPTIINKNPTKVNDEAVGKSDKLDDESIDKIKNLLSGEGFTESEISSIKNLKDLKKLLMSKSKDGTLKTGEDLTNLLSMLGSLLGPKAQENFADIKKLLESVIPQIKTAATKFLSSGGSVDALKTFQDETDNVLSSNKQAIENLAPEDLKLLKAALTNEVNSAIKNVASNPASSTNNELTIKIKNEITTSLDKYKGESNIVNSNIDILLSSALPQIKDSIIKAVNSGGTLDALKLLQDETDNILSSSKQTIENLTPEDLKLFKTALTNEVNGVVKNAVINSANSSNMQLSIKIKNEITSTIDKYKSEGSIANLSDITNQGDLNINMLLDSTLPQIKDSINKAVNSGVTTEALKLLSDETDNILSSNKQTISSLSPDDLKLFKGNLTDEVQKIVSSVTTKISSKIEQTFTLVLDKYKSDNTDSSEIKLVKILPDVKLTTIVNVQDLKGENLEDKSSSDNNILTKLVEPGDDSSKIDKVTNFMTQFTNTTTPVKTDPVQNPIIDIKNVNTGIVDSLKYMQQGDIKNLTVTITPKELGTVVINLIMQNGTMMASITASNKEAYNLINSNLPDISAKLQNLNIAVQDLSLNIYSQDTTFFKGGSMWQDQQQQQQQNNQNAYKKPTSILDAPEEIMTQSSLNSNVNILA